MYFSYVTPLCGMKCLSYILTQIHNIGLIVYMYTVRMCVYHVRKCVYLSSIFYTASMDMANKHTDRTLWSYACGYLNYTLVLVCCLALKETHLDGRPFSLLVHIEVD